MNQAEAFAAITVAAVASDSSFVDAEAKLIREQLLRRAPFRSRSSDNLILLARRPETASS